MRNAGKVTAGGAVGLLLTAVVHADVTLNAARVGAEDVAADAKFYESAFGLKEVNRLQLPGNIEIMMNFGSSVEAAKGNSNPQVVVMHRASNNVDDPVPHIIFNVTDMAATVAAVKAAGGSMQGEPRPFGNTGIVIGIAKDPAGNRLELIQRPKQ